MLEKKPPGFDKEKEKESENDSYGMVKSGNNPLGGIWNMGGGHVHDCICECLKRIAKISEEINARGTFDKTSQEEALYAAAWGVKWNEGALTELVEALDKIHKH